MYPFLFFLLSPSPFFSLLLLFLLYSLFLLPLFPFLSTPMFPPLLQFFSSPPLFSSSFPYSSSFLPSRYSITLRCWCENAEKRPPFSELVRDLNTSLETIASYMDFTCLSVVNDKEGHPYDLLLVEQDEDS